MVSIIVPVYNVEKYLARCLDSLIYQTYRNIEIIVVNDGSTDSCTSIIRQYAIVDTRLKVINKQNGGLASARNAGVAISNGDYIWHVDSDDYITSDGLEKMVEVARRDKCDIVVSGHNNVPDENKINEYFYAGPKFNKIISGKEALCLMLCTNIGGDVWTKLYKKELYTDHKIVQNEEFSAPEDVLLNYQLFLHAKRISPLEHVSIFHIYRVNSLSSQAKAKMNHFLIQHHLGLVYIANYGFPDDNVKYAYYGYIGSDFLRCYKCYNMELLKKIGITRIKDYKKYLYYLSCYSRIRDNEVRLSFKRRYIYAVFKNVFIRILASSVLKIFSLTFKKK